MGTAGTFPDLLKQADEALPLKLGEFGKGGIGQRSHVFRDEKDSGFVFLRQDADRFHRPTDTADKINFKDWSRLRTWGSAVATAMARDAASAIQRQLRHPGPDANGGWVHGTRAALAVVPDNCDGDDGSGA